MNQYLCGMRVWYFPNKWEVRLIWDASVSLNRVASEDPRLCYTQVINTSYETPVQILNLRIVFGLICCFGFNKKYVFLILTLWEKKLNIKQFNVNHCWISASTTLSPSPSHVHTSRHRARGGHTRTHTHTHTLWHTDSGYPLFIHGSEYSLALHSSFTSPQGVCSLARLPLHNTPYWLLPTTTRPRHNAFMGLLHSWVWKRTGPRWRAGHIKRSSSSIAHKLASSTGEDWRKSVWG